VGGGYTERGDKWEAAIDREGERAVCLETALDECSEIRL